MPGQDDLSRPNQLFGTSWLTDFVILPGHGLLPHQEAENTLILCFGKVSQQDFDVKRKQAEASGRNREKIYFYG